MDEPSESPASEPAKRLTLYQLSEFAGQLQGRCRLMTGALAGQTWMVVGPADVAALAAIEATLARMAPFADGIRRLITRGEQDT